MIRSWWNRKPQATADGPNLHVQVWSVSQERAVRFKALCSPLYLEHLEPMRNKAHSRGLFVWSPLCVSSRAAHGDVVTAGEREREREREKQGEEGSRGRLDCRQGATYPPTPRGTRYKHRRRRRPGRLPLLSHLSHRRSSGHRRMLCAGSVYVPYCWLNLLVRVYFDCCLLANLMLACGLFQIPIRVGRARLLATC
jgi:hypothetical protein